MENLFANLAGQFEDEVVGNLAGALGIPPENARSALAAAVPAIATAVAGKVAQPDNAAGLMRTFDILTSMGSSRPKTMIAGLLNDDRAMHAGANMAKSLFGDQLGATVESLVGQTGVDAGVAGKLLGMAVPAVMGALGTQARQKGVDAAGLAAFLNEVDKPAEASAQGETTPSPKDASSDATSIAESLKRGLKKLFGRA